MKYFISKIIPHRDRCWEAVTFKNKEINTCLQEGWKDYCGLLFWGCFFFFTAWAEWEEGRENKVLREEEAVSELKGELTT